jgi:dihydrofolate reductase
MIISLIVAASTNNVIGVNNQLPWHLPADMKFFKNTTWGMPVIMGRKTFESMNSKPLPGRVNIIITRSNDWKAEGVIVVHDIEASIEEAINTDCKEMFVIGGGEIFEKFLPVAHRIYMTRVHTRIEGDVFFPEFDRGSWQLAEQRDMQRDEKHAFDFTFERWEKK